ncbi:MAG TPA: hypothetical protein VNZ47_15250 [Candidatus Dormibacteraeota bacterium]|jgi:hypothetical protein|nr:hypothetical protein [Candidatus Dormibacteraeota bacterium]
MENPFKIILIAGLLTFAYPATALQAAPAPAHLENGSILYAELSKTVDAKKAKVGDPVNAVLVADVLSHGKIAVRHDSKLIGHVTEVQPHTKETPESRLGIVFDKVITKGGEVPFQSLLLAIRPAERAVVDVPQAPTPMPNSGTQPMQTSPSPQVPRIDRTMGDEMKSHDRKMAEAGPTDIDGLSLSSPGNGGAQTIVSTQRTVKLESGVKIELRVTGQ